MLIQVCAGQRDTVVHTVRGLMRAVAGHLTIRWMIDGFQTFNQDPKRQFATIRRRLETEPMTDYILPVGGGYFFAPPGARGGGDWVGSGMAARA